MDRYTFFQHFKHLVDLNIQGRQPKIQPIKQSQRHKWNVGCITCVLLSLCNLDFYLTYLINQYKRHFPANINITEMLLLK